MLEYIYEYAAQYDDSKWYSMSMLNPIPEPEDFLDAWEKKYEVGVGAAQPPELPVTVYLDKDDFWREVYWKYVMDSMELLKSGKKEDVKVKSKDSFALSMLEDDKFPETVGMKFSVELLKSSERCSLYAHESYEFGDGNFDKHRDWPYWGNEARGLDNREVHSWLDRCAPHVPKIKMTVETKDSVIVTYE